MGKDKKKKKDKEKGKKQKKDRQSTPLESFEKLLAKVQKCSRKGKARKLDALLDGLGDEDRTLTAVQDARGLTPLHVASQAGHEDAVRVLLRHGADPGARDKSGNTPAHLAAAANHLIVLQILLSSPQPPKITLRNNKGQSIEDLVNACLERDKDKGTSSADEGPSIRAASSMSYSGSESEGTDEEAAWRRRLAEEASDHEGSEWRGHVDHGDTAQSGGGGGDGGDDDDAWADRLWQEMQQRRRQEARKAARSFASSFAEARAAEAAAREERERERLERLREAERVLREERERDQQWRQRAQQGGVQGPSRPVAALNPAQARLDYARQWRMLEEKITAGAVTSLAFRDIPWPLPEGHGYSVDALRDVLLGDTSSPGEVKRRLRAELMRWHPDKFTAKLGALLADPDKESILSRVKEVSQSLTRMMGGAA